MQAVLVDTDIISLFFRNNPNVVSNFKNYLAKHAKINLCIISYYEILSGLKHRDALKQLSSFLEFAKLNVILPLSEETVILSSDVYAASRKAGKPIDDIDILIAGVALANDLILVTNNEDHFSNIEGLEIINWSKEVVA